MLAWSSHNWGDGAAPQMEKHQVQQQGRVREQAAGVDPKHRGLVGGGVLRVLSITGRCRGTWLPWRGHHRGGRQELTACQGDGRLD